MRSRRTDRAPRAALLVGVVVVPLLVACADDGNDRAGGGWTTFPDAPIGTTPIDATPDDAVTDAAPDDTRPDDTTLDGAEPAEQPDVEPTGVVVPVIALDNSFRPEVVEVAVGDEVVWENRGMNEHDVLYVEGDDWGVEVEQFQPGDTYAHVFTEPGEYRYYCSIHGNTEVGMVGTVVVTG